MKYNVLLASLAVFRDCCHPNCNVLEFRFPPQISAMLLAVWEGIGDVYRGQMININASMSGLKLIKSYYLTNPDCQIRGNRI